MFKRVRSKCKRTSYVHTEGTEMSYIRHENHEFLPFVYQMCAWYVRILESASRVKIQHLSFPTPYFDRSTHHGYF